MATRCSTHPRARAAWVCQSCERTLCPDCAVARSLAHEETAVCVHCGGFGRWITRKREIAPFWTMLPRFLSAIFSQAGLVQLLAVALVQSLAGALPVVGGPIAAVIFISYYFRVIASAAQGAETLPEPEDFLGAGSLAGPVFRFGLATAAIWLPALLYLIYGVGLETVWNDPSRALSDPLLVLLPIAGIIYCPAAIIAAAVAESALAVLNPLITIRMILRIPAQYVAATAIWAGLTLLDLLLVVPLEAIGSALWIPFVTPVLLRMAGLLLPVLSGFVLGRLIYQNHEHFGVLPLGDDLEREWPDACPRATVAPTEETAIPIPLEPIPLEPIPLDPSALIELGVPDLPGTLAVDADGNLVPVAAVDLGEEPPKS